MLKISSILILFWLLDERPFLIDKSSFLDQSHRTIIVEAERDVLKMISRAKIEIVMGIRFITAKALSGEKPSKKLICYFYITTAEWQEY